MPIDVARVILLFVETFGSVTVKDRSAEGNVFAAIAIAANGEMPAGHHELKLARARRAEQCDRLALAISVRVVLQRAAPGNRYAIATIVQYVIVLVGIIVALGLIGVGWSNRWVAGE